MHSETWAIEVITKLRKRSKALSKDYHSTDECIMSDIYEEIANFMSEAIDMAQEPQ